MKNKKIVKKGIWTFLMLAVFCLWMFPDTAYGIVEKRFSWNGFVYVEDFPKEDFVTIVDYTKNGKKLSIPSKIRGKKVGMVSSLGDAKKLKTLSLPDGVEVAANALSQCPNLKTVQVKKSNSLYRWENGLLLTKDGKKLVACPGGNQNPKIPDAVTSIGESAFAGTAIKNITLGKNITDLGSYAFWNCRKLEQITFHPEGKIPLIPSGVWQGCTSLKEIRIPDSVTEIWGHNFSGCENLETVVLGKNAAYMESDNFGGCSSLSRLYVPNAKLDTGYLPLIDAHTGVVNVKVYAPRDAEFLESLTAIEEPLQNLEIEELDPSVFMIPEYHPDMEILQEQGVTYVLHQEGTEKFLEVVGYTGTDARLSLPQQAAGIPVKKITSLGNTKVLTQLHIPETVTVTAKALAGCQNLKKVTVSSKNKNYRVKNSMLLTKDQKTLVACPGGVKNPVIPKSVMKIGDGAFAGGTIQKITLGKQIVSVGQGAFENCHKLKTVKFEKESRLKFVDSRAFENCKSLVSVELPDSVEEVMDYVFYGCKKLKRVTLGKNLQYLGHGSLQECDRLTDLYVYSRDCVLSSGGNGVLSGIKRQNKLTVHGMEGSTIQQEASLLSEIKFRLLKEGTVS